MISSEKQLIYDSFGNAVNKAKSIDYSKIPTDDQLPKEPGKVKVDKSTEAIDREYLIDAKAMDEFEKEWSEKQNKREGIVENYYNNLDLIIAKDKNSQDIVDFGSEGSNFGEYDPTNVPDYAFNNYNITYVTEGVKCIPQNDINKYYYMRGLYKKGLIDEQTLTDFENYLYKVGGQIYENNRKRTEQAKGNLNYDKKPVHYFQSGVRGIEDTGYDVLQLADYYLGNKVAPQVKTAESTALDESKIRVSDEQKEKGENIGEDIRALMLWGKTADFSRSYFYYKKQGYTEKDAFYKALLDTIALKQDPSPTEFYNEYKSYNEKMKKLKLPNIFK